MGGGLSLVESSPSHGDTGHPPGGASSHQSRNPRATTAGRHTFGSDSLVPLSAEREQSGGLDNFVERRKQSLREVRLALEKQHKLRVTATAPANASISRPSAGVALEKGSLVLVHESESSRHRDNSGRKLQHDLYTGP